MARLTTAQRKRLPASEFGLPSKRAYPMPDRAHAIAAEARAAHAKAIGHITEAQKEKIDRKAQRIINRGK